MLTVRRYTHEQADAWNDFVARSKNGTFLLDRRYMDYHADRFEDHSLMVTVDDALVAVLPANRDGQTLVSHGGLTYGGFVVDASMTTARMLELFEATRDHLRGAFEALVYKCIPHVYHRQAAEEDLYALFRLGAKRSEVDVASAVCLGERPPLKTPRRRAVRRAERAGLEVVRSHDFAGYFALLDRRLQARYDVAPTHTAEEMRRLAARFPRNIAMYCAVREEAIFGGAIVYDCGPCVHAQYLLNTGEGLELGALDLVVDTLITRVYADRRWFDLGRSTEQGGRHLNEGLLWYKETFGARAIVYSAYHLDLT